MSSRVIITVQKGGREMDVDVPVSMTLSNLLTLLGWGGLQVAIIQDRNQILGGDDPLEGRIKEGDLVIVEENTAWN
jgi:hypothetical protein